MMKIQGLQAPHGITSRAPDLGAKMADVALTMAMTKEVEERLRASINQQRTCYNISLGRLNNFCCNFVLLYYFYPFAISFPFA